MPAHGAIQPPGSTEVGNQAQARRQGEPAGDRAAIQAQARAHHEPRRQLPLILQPGATAGGPPPRREHRRKRRAEPNAGTVGLLLTAIARDVPGPARVERVKLGADVDGMANRRREHRLVAHSQVADPDPAADLELQEPAVQDALGSVRAPAVVETPAPGHPGMTWSTRCAARSVMRRLPGDQTLDLAPNAPESREPAGERGAPATRTGRGGVGAIAREERPKLLLDEARHASPSRRCAASTRNVCRCSRTTRCSTSAAGSRGV